MDLSKYRHFSFDLDGTLVHTVPEYRYAIVPKTAELAGGTVSDRTLIDKFWFESGRSKIIEEDFGISSDDFWKHFRQLDTPEYRSAHTHAYEDAEPFLRFLKSKGHMVSIVTGAPQWIAEMEIAKLNGVELDHFTSIAWSDFPDKPDPAALFHTLTALKSAPHETLYLGNSNEDAMFAKNAGVDFVYLERKEHEFFMGDYALKTVESLKELEAFMRDVTDLSTKE